MTSPPASEVVDIQLVLVRSLLHRANHAASSGADVDLMVAMLLADVANETIAKTVLKHLGLNTGGNMADFRTRLQQAVPALAGDPAMAGATRLRSARNPVQHDGMVPARPNVIAHLRDAHTFVATLVKATWQRDLEQVSAASLVHDPLLSPVLTSAIDCLRVGALDDGAVRIGAVYEAIRIRFKRAARFAGGVSVTEEQERYLPALGAPTAAAVFGESRTEIWMEPRLAEDQYGAAAELLIGFSLQETAQLRRLIAATDRFVRHDTASVTEAGFSAADLTQLLEVVARQLWRLETEQPSLFGRLSEPRLFRG